MDILLGIFKPRHDSTHIWDLKLRPEHMRDGKYGRRSSEVKLLMRDSVAGLVQSDGSLARAGLSAVSAMKGLLAKDQASVDIRALNKSFSDDDDEDDDESSEGSEKVDEFDNSLLSSKAQAESFLPITGSLKINKFRTSRQHGYYSDFHGSSLMLTSFSELTVDHDLLMDEVSPLFCPSFNFIPSYILNSCHLDRIRAKRRSDTLRSFLGPSKAESISMWKTSLLIQLHEDLHCITNMIST